MNYQPRKTKTKPLKIINMGIKTRLSLTTSFMVIVSLRPRPLRKTSVIEMVEKTIQLLRST